MVRPPFPHRVCAAMLAVVFLILLEGCTHRAPAEPPQMAWLRDFGSPNQDDARMVALTPDGGFIAAGNYNFNYDTPTDIYAVRVTGDGDLVWERQIDAGYIAKAKDIIAVSSGGYLVTGYFIADGDWQMIAVRIDENGDELWRVEHGHVNRREVGWRSRELADGSFFTCGSTLSMVDDDRDGFLLKISPDGQLHWEKFYGGASEERITAMALTDDGGAILAGKTRTLSPTAYGDVWALRVNSSGFVQWERHYGGLGADEALWIEPAHQPGRYLLTGSWTEPLGSEDAFVLTIDDQGDSLSWFPFGQPAQHDLGQMVIPVEGGIVLTGSTSDPGLTVQFSAARFDSVGHLEWALSGGGSSFERGYAIRELPDRGYIVAGAMTPSEDSSYQLMMMRLTPDGNLVDDPETVPEGLPISPALVRVYPNPFNQSATVELVLARPGRVKLELVNLLGQPITTLHDGELGGGTHRLSFDAPHLPTGNYLLRVRQGSVEHVRRVTVVR